MVGILSRSGVDEEARRGAGGADFEAAPPKALASRFVDTGGLATGGGVGNEERAATAGGPLLTAACPLSRIARRSSRDRFMPGRTDRFLDREVFGAIALEECSDTGFTRCGVRVGFSGKAEA